MENDAGAEVLLLATRLQKLLDNHLNQKHEPSDPCMKEAAELRGNITKYGYLAKIIWSAKIHAETGAIEQTAEVQIFQPKKNMTEEETALYDKWFAEANSKKPGET